jgi:alpha-galactosidase
MTPTFARFGTIVSLLVVPLAGPTESHARQVSAQESPDASLNLNGAGAPAHAVWLDDLDLSAIKTGFGRAVARASVTGNPISIGGTTYLHGVGVHSDSEGTFALDGKAVRFVADVGVDDELSCLSGSGADKMAASRFRVLVDGKVRADSGVMKFGAKPRRLSVDLTGARTLTLEVKKENKARYNHVDWAGAAIVMAAGHAARPTPVRGKNEPPEQAPRQELSAADEAILLGPALSGPGSPALAFVETLDLTNARYLAADKIGKGKQVGGKPLVLGGTPYARGLGIMGEGEIHIDLGGAGRRFLARVGIDGGMHCEKVLDGGSAKVEVWLDSKKVVDTDMIRGYDRPLDVVVDLKGARRLVLVTRLGSGAMVPVVWAGAAIELEPAAKVRPRTMKIADPPIPPVATPRPLELAINGPRIVGTSPGRDFVFLVPATGRRPLAFEATGLPAGLQLNSGSGVISGRVARRGRYAAIVAVKDAGGKRVERTLTIVAEPDGLALTPPMGWNSWNVWGLEIDADKIKAAADALVASGLASYGYSYVNIDDAWEGTRDGKGQLRPNERFPDMVGLSAYVHSKGLKLGIYTSPGPKTCGGYEGSYQHETRDAKTFASWGIDYLKHDWCSYGNVARGTDRAMLMKPYTVMGKALRASGRDIVYSLCQYGMGDVWTWGRQVGGHLWRTTGDIVDTWGSVETIGFSQAGKEAHAGPGGWNDPDMLVVGRVGWSKNLRDSRLTPAEQLTHLTLWSLLGAPLLLGNDLTALDPWTLAILTNPEVIDVDQDPLGKTAVRKSQKGALEIWARPLHDGTWAVGLFNRGMEEATVTVDLGADLGLSGAQPVRDLWQRHDLGRREGQFSANVLAHGAVLVKVGTPKTLP